MDRKQVFNNKIRNSLFLRPFEFYVYKCFKPKRIFVRICAVSFLRFFHILTFKRRESRGGYRELRSAKICDALAKYLPNVIAVSMRCRYSHSLKNKKPSYQLENKLFAVQKGRNRVSVINQVFFRGKFQAEQQQNNNGEMEGAQNLNKLQKYFIGRS